MSRFNKIIMIAGLFFSTISSAQGYDYYYYCQQFNAYPRQCIQAGCFYSSIFYQCLASDGTDVPDVTVQYYNCSQYSGSRMHCASMGCTYNSRTGWCYGPQPHY